MHDLEGLFCKTGKSWDNAKFAGPGKKHIGPNLLGQQCTGEGLEGRSPMGFSPSVRRLRAGRGGGRSRPAWLGLALTWLGLAR